MDKNQWVLFMNVSLGAIGTILIGLAALEAIANQENTIYFLLFAGFLLVIHYINYLEKRAGVENTVTWARAIGSIIVLVAFGFLLIY